MKFDVVIGNPPYDDGSRQQIYTDFYVESREIAGNVCLIFPTGWQEPKDANNLRKMNNEEIKRDRQIIHIENIKSAFANIPGADSTNIILWRKGYDNKLNGKQLIITEDKKEKIKLSITRKDILKPQFIRDLEEIIKQDSNFESIQKIISRRKPYGLSTNILKNNKGLGLPPLHDEKVARSDIRILTPKGIKFVSEDYPFPKKGAGFNSYKVFVPYAWGNWREEVGLGGAYANIFIAQPKDASIETYLECGKFNTQKDAEKLAKYMMTQFFRALLYVNKYSQHSTTAFGAIPMQNFSEDWWTLTVEEINIKLYKKYNIPNEIREKIGENIQLRDDDNIVFM